MIYLIVGVVIVSALLVLIILAQNSKGGGLSSQFGGSSTSQIIGVKKTGDLLERLTWGLFAALIIMSLSSNFIVDKGSGEAGPGSSNIETAAEKQSLQDNFPVPVPTESPDSIN